MNCRAVVANLAPLIDRQLAEHEEQPIIQHLAVCESCANEERELRWLKRLLANSASCDVDPNFEARLEANLRELIANSDRVDPCSPYQDSQNFSRPISLWQIAPVTLLTLWLITQTVLPASETPSRPTASTSRYLEASTSPNRDDPTFGSQELTQVGFRR